ncbi:alpha/beta fold hydrolase [Tepidimicrobium xylanilyticum]|uniref:Pimeloyl-ACP methyl ester carboxylesterase n=2 Tax=Tepidimicrobium xylanilyticum TaxID=1123352 RepID=A0A1H3CIG7_9FIRM|nr:alpha/beta hydrolase [Tepidimicrobium xylanilyticum]GMG97992.1 lipolytic protein [Tepidimicrobium xylanilyticum]SDX53269.1 Pimeloyl-ACP methyl ester carboxylesterase [Tepidimicrobium xylanilyticum]
MPYVNIMDKNIYYKVYGEGESIVFLNGMMMATNSWSPFIKDVTKDFKMITVDLLDQGKSDSFEGFYNIETQSDFLKRFLDEIQIERAHLVGMSYGGKVALTFASKYEYKVRSLILSNTASFTTNILREIGKGWGYAASTLDVDVFSSVVLPYMYSYKYYEKNYNYIKKMKKALSKTLNLEWYEKFIRGLQSMSDYNVHNRIKDIKVPTLIISSELDILMPVKYQYLIHREIENSKWIILKEVGHASMYEKPGEYISTVMEFLMEQTREKV